MRKIRDNKQFWMILNVICLWILLTSIFLRCDDSPIIRIANGLHSPITAMKIGSAYFSMINALDDCDNYECITDYKETSEGYQDITFYYLGNIWTKNIRDISSLPLINGFKYVLSFSHAFIYAEDTILMELATYNN
jgi:hypothetical protein